MLNRQIEGIIHLGRSKSQRKHSKRQSELSPRKSTYRSSMEQQPLQQISSNKNNSMNMSSQLKYNTQSQQNFYPRPSTVKQNERVFSSTMSPNMFPKSIRPTSPNSPTIIMGQATPYFKQNQQQIQMKRKIGILESRVHELHQEKNNQKLILDQQNRKLLQENDALRKNLQQCQLVKNMEIQYLQREIKTLQDLRKFQYQENQAQCQQKLMLQAQQAENRDRLSLKNAIYVDDLEKQSYNDFRTQYHQDYQEKENSVITKRSKDQLQYLRIRNIQLERQLQQTRSMIKQDAHTIQDNNTKIISQYERKIHELQQALQQKIQQEQEAYEKLENIKEEHRVQMQILEAKCYNIQQQFSIIQNQKADELHRKEQMIEVLKYDNQCLQQKIDNRKQVQSCQKCKQLIKNLMKLNQKTMPKLQ